jgi:Domain of unknown function (DUF1707)
MTAGAGAQNAPGYGHLLAADADRERVIEALKVAFVGGRLTRDKFDARIGRALTSRTYAELAAVTADIPAGPTGVQSRRRDFAGSATLPALARHITRDSSIMRIIRVRQWPRVLVAGLVLVILGLTLVPGGQRPQVIFLGVMLILQAAARGVVKLPSDQAQDCRCVARNAGSHNARAAA